MVGRNKKGVFKLVTGALAIALLVSGCASKSGGDTGKSGDNPLLGKKVALVMQFNQGTFSAQYVEGVTEQVKKFGGEVKVFDSQNDLAKMASNLDAAVNQKFDAILIDHGQADALEAGVQKALDAKIQVAVFDADIKKDGVTVLQQDDKQLTEMTLERMKKDIGGKGKLVKIWVPGFAPMERRQVAYEAFMKANPDMKEIAAFGDANNAALTAQTQMEAVLKQYPNKGDITAVWASWDEFAKGATRAIQQAGRTEIKVYGIDLSDEDLQMIQDANSPWVASAAVDPKDIGRVHARIAYQQLHGDKPEPTFVLNPVIVHRDDLPKTAVSTTELSKHVKGWGGSTQGYVDWMKDLEAAASK